LRSFFIKTPDVQLFSLSQFSHNVAFIFYYVQATRAHFGRSGTVWNLCPLSYQCPVLHSTPQTWPLLIIWVT